MNRFWRLFIVWALVLSALPVLANWPRDLAPLKPEFSWAGFPWMAAYWVSGRLVFFDPRALLGDLLLGVAFVGTIAFTCAIARTRQERSGGSERAKIHY